MRAMARPRRIECRRCGRHVDECGPLSARGRCAECGRRALEANLDQLHFHSGPRFEFWRHRLLAAFGVQTPNPFDELEQEVDQE